MKNKNLTLFAISVLLFISCSSKNDFSPESLSGIYPRLAYYNIVKASVEQEQLCLGQTGFG